MNTSKIMIVEDESIVALDLQSRLSRIGYHVVGIANSRQDAIQIAREFHPQLAMMDIRLKEGEDGIELAHELGSIYGIPVIYLTAYADDSTIERAKHTEPLGYLVKPFEERELHSTIEMALYKLEMDRQIQVQFARLERVIETMPAGVALLDTNFQIITANALGREYLRDLSKSAEDEPIHYLADIPITHFLQQSDMNSCHEISTTDAAPRIFEVIISIPPRVSDFLPSTENEWVIIIRDVTIERQLQEKAAFQDRISSLGHFAAGIAHEFNNILATVLLAPDLIQKIEPQLSSKSIERLESIHQVARRGSDLVRQILDFSHASELQLHNQDLTTLLQEVKMLLNAELSPTIQLEVEYQPNDYTLYGDRDRILQLIMNLMRNAQDAMPDGGKISIQLDRITKISEPLVNPREWLCLRVSDTGIGIDSDVLPHIFEPFYSTKKSDRDTGLGLAQVYGIIQQHGGSIDVKSRLGYGTTFTVYFPALPIANSEHQFEIPSPTLLSSSQKCILLVEDNLALRETTRDILELVNYVVIEASNGQEALDILKNHGFAIDLILSDLDMPVMDGLEMSRQIRQQQLTIPIVIISGYLSDQYLQEMHQLSISNYLRKPVSLDKLVSAIDKILH
jgi:hypothetical protein